MGSGASEFPSPPSASTKGANEQQPSLGLPSAGGVAPETKQEPLPSLEQEGNKMALPNPQGGGFNWNNQMPMLSSMLNSVGGNPQIGDANPATGNGVSANPGIMMNNQAQALPNFGTP